jgi:hypothetical protein
MSPWISVGALLLSLLTTVGAVTAVIVQMRASVATLSRDDDRREKREQEADKRRQDREDSATKELRDFLVLLQSFISAQTEINKKVEAALTGTINEIADIRDHLADIKQHVAQGLATKELLIEMVKKIRGVSIEP